MNDQDTNKKSNINDFVFYYFIIFFFKIYFLTIYI